MIDLDHFESTFKSAAKPRFKHEAITVKKVTVVTDLEGDEAPQAFLKQVKLLTRLVLDDPDITWTMLNRGDYESPNGLITQLEEQAPDLICTYRNLYTRGKVSHFSLGTYLDVMAQTLTTPVMVFPRPKENGVIPLPLETIRDVLALTDHLQGADRLVNFAVRFTASEGRLVLVHLEDDATFERYIDAISKIPEINTDTARETLHKQLLKEPRDFIKSCIEVLKSEKVQISKIEKVVEMGHHISVCRKIIKEHETELLVFNTKDEDQLAMHGLAYPLAVELRDVILLML